jgi:hypothetical protein
MVHFPTVEILKVLEGMNTIYFFVAIINASNINSISTSPSGWTDQEICEQWFICVFIPFATVHRVKDKPIVLTLDGHDSHETPAMQHVAFDNNIILFCFSSKTTHKLQTLDVLVISPVQWAWSSHLWFSGPFPWQV